MDANQVLEGGFTYELIDGSEDAYKGAKLFLELAKKTEDNFEKRQDIRASIIFSVISLEAYLTVFIAKRYQIEKGITDEEALRFARTKKCYTLRGKIKYIVEKAIKRAFDESKEPYSSLVKILKVRDGHIHFKGSEFRIEMAQKAINVAKDMIVEIHKFDNSPYPKWLEE